MTSSGSDVMFFPVMSIVMPVIRLSGSTERTPSPPAAFFQASRTKAMTWPGDIGGPPEARVGAGAGVGDVSLPRAVSCCGCDCDGGCCCPGRVGGIRREAIACAFASVSGSRLLATDEDNCAPLQSMNERLAYGDQKPKIGAGARLVGITRIGAIEPYNL